MVHEQCWLSHTAGAPRSSRCDNDVERRLGGPNSTNSIPAMESQRSWLLSLQTMTSRIQARYFNERGRQLRRPRSFFYSRRCFLPPKALHERAKPDNETLYP